LLAAAVHESAIGTDTRYQRDLRTSADGGWSGHVLCSPEATRMTQMYGPAVRSKKISTS
jgi:hypothetical protein